MIRNRATKAVRDYLDNNGFLDIETPMLIRVHQKELGLSCAFKKLSRNILCTSSIPQIFKQLLMVSGFDKYYQIVKCFRDEDLKQIDNQNLLK